MVTLNRLVAINATPETLEPTIDRRVRYGTVRTYHNWGMREMGSLERLLVAATNIMTSTYIFKPTQQYRARLIDTTNNTTTTTYLPSHTIGDHQPVRSREC